MQFLLRLLISVAFCEAAAAQDGPQPGIHETVAAYLEQSAFEVALSAEGGLEGPAAEWFRAEASEAQFVFIGEEHDVREVPILVGALWRELVPLGYEHVAIEAGPWLGDRLDKFARFADQQALAHFQGATLPRLPNNSVPPISEEDVAFYEELGSVSGPHRKSAAPLIWGLDAEYRAAPLLKRLAELSPRPARRRAVQSLLEQVGAAERNGDYNTRAFRDAIEQVTDASRGDRAALHTRCAALASRRARGTHERRPQEGTTDSLMFGGYHAARGLAPHRLAERGAEDNCRDGDPRPAPGKQRATTVGGRRWTLFERSARRSGKRD